MFKRELKVNLKSFIIWTLISMVLYLVVFLVYPSIVNSPEISSMDEMMNMFPEELLKAFNMDISSIDSVYGWLKSEGFIFVLLIINCYAGILGSNILLKEENDKTIEYINTLPVKRTNLVLSKSLVGVIYITLITLFLAIFNYIGLDLSGDFDSKQYILLSLTPLLSAYVVYFLCLFISTFTNKSKKMLGVSLGIVILSYLLNTLSSLTKDIEFLKYFSVFTLSDIRNVIIDIAISPVMIIITIVLSISFLVLSIIHYNKKELV